MLFSPNIFYTQKSLYSFNSQALTQFTRSELSLSIELKAAGVPVEQFREITQETFEGMLEQVSMDDQRAIVMMGLVDALVVLQV